MSEMVFLTTDAAFTTNAIDAPIALVAGALTAASPRVHPYSPFPARQPGRAPITRMGGPLQAVGAHAPHRHFDVFISHCIWPFRRDT